MTKTTNGQDKGSAKDLSNLSWEHSIVDARKQSEVRAWRVAGAALVLAFLCVIALALSMPLRQTVTRIVEIDKLTGETGMISDLPAYVSKRNDINDKFWLKKYVVAHERYIGKILQLDFDTVKILSGDVVYEKYRKLFTGSNALQTKLENRIEIIPTILSITIPSPNIATVRFEVKTTNVGNPAINPETTRYIATINYHYTPNIYAKESDLIDNPLGFSIDTYQIDPEVVTTTDVQAPAAAAPSAPPAPVIPAGGVAPTVPAIGAKP